MKPADRDLLLPGLDLGRPFVLPVRLLPLDLRRPGVLPIGGGRGADEAVEPGLESRDAVAEGLQVVRLGPDPLEDPPVGGGARGPLDPDQVLDGVEEVEGGRGRGRVRAQEVEREADVLGILQERGECEGSRGEHGGLGDEGGGPAEKRVPDVDSPE